MFSQDSERGRPRGGQSSWGGDWSRMGNDNNYGREQSRSSPEPSFRRQGFGRSNDQEDSGSSQIVCQNFLQNKCLRGNKCLFLHPSPSAGSGGPRRPSSSDLNKQQNPWLNFCPNFQRGQCPFSDDCRLLHVSKRDEAEFKSSGIIPTGLVEQAMSKSMVMDWAYVGNHPHCKNYLQGSCVMRGCSLRHLDMDQYVVEVMGVLRQKFMIAHEEMFEGNNQDRMFANNRRGDQFGTGLLQQQSPVPPVNSFGGRGNDFEPDMKRIRGDDFNAPTTEWAGRRENTRGGFSQERETFTRPSGQQDEDFLDGLRRQNSKLTETNGDLKQRAQALEDDNTALRKAMRLALDLNSHARNLQEFRSHLREIQMSLNKKGIRHDKYFDSAPWINRDVERPSSSQDNRIRGDNYSMGFNNAGPSKDFDRMDMPQNNFGRYNSKW